MTMPAGTKVRLTKEVPLKFLLDGHYAAASVAKATDRRRCDVQARYLGADCFDYRNRVRRWLVAADHCGAAQGLDTFAEQMVVIAATP